jgi:hypothetical protein
MVFGDWFIISAGIASQQRSKHVDKKGETLPTYMTTGRRLQPLRLSTSHLRLGELYTRGDQVLSSGERPVGASYGPKNTTRSAQ